jgi:hypothetical protein
MGFVPAAASSAISAGASADGRFRFTPSIVCEDEERRNAVQFPFGLGNCLRGRKGSGDTADIHQANGMQWSVERKDIM